MSHKATYWLSRIDPKRISAGAFRVLFHLCDHHNEERDPELACFPSQATLIEKTGLSNGGLNKCLDTLEAAGLLARKSGTVPGKRQRRTYYILGCDAPGTTGQTPLSGDRTNSTPVETDTEQTPLLDGTNSTFCPIKLHPSGEEPVRNSKKEQVGDKSAIDWLCEVVSSETALGFIEMRKAIKKPLTPLAAKLIAKELNGHPLAEKVVQTSIKNSWQGVFPDRAEFKTTQSQQTSKREEQIARWNRTAL